MTFELKDFAFAHIGLSQSYEKNVGKIKEKLRPAIRELIEAGFLEPMAEEAIFKEERVEGRLPREAGSGHRQEEQLATSSPRNSSVASHAITARELAGLPRRDNPKLEALDWRVEKRDKRVSKSPSGYLVKAIQEGYAIPKGCLSRVDREAARKAIEAKTDGAKAQKAEKAGKNAERQAILAHWEGLNAEQRDRLVNLALEAAPPESRECYEAQPEVLLAEETRSRHDPRRLHSHSDWMTTHRPRPAWASSASARSSARGSSSDLAGGGAGNGCPR